MFRFNPRRPTDRRSAVLDTSDPRARRILTRARAAARDTTDPQPRSSLRRELDGLTTGQLSNCDGCQEVTVGECQGWPVFTMALRITSILRIHATRATFFGLPAASSLW